LECSELSPLSPFGRRPLASGHAEFVPFETVGEKNTKAVTSHRNPRAPTPTAIGSRNCENGGRKRREHCSSGYRLNAETRVFGL